MYFAKAKINVQGERLFGSSEYAVTFTYINCVADWVPYDNGLFCSWSFWKWCWVLHKSVFCVQVGSWVCECSHFQICLSLCMRCSGVEFATWPQFLMCASQFPVSKIRCHQNSRVYNHDLEASRPQKLVIRTQLELDAVPASCEAYTTRITNTWPQQQFCKSFCRSRRGSSWCRRWRTVRWSLTVRRSTPAPWRMRRWSLRRPPDPSSAGSRASWSVSWSECHANAKHLGARVEYCDKHKASFPSHGFKSHLLRRRSGLSQSPCRRCRCRGQQTPRPLHTQWHLMRLQLYFANGCGFNSDKRRCCSVVWRKASLHFFGVVSSQRKKKVLASVSQFLVVNCQFQIDCDGVGGGRTFPFWIFQKDFNGLIFLVFLLLSCHPVPPPHKKNWEGVSQSYYPVSHVVRFPESSADWGRLFICGDISFD